jgi:hypothetical protein
VEKSEPVLWKGTTPVILLLLNYEDTSIKAEKAFSELSQQFNNIY